MARILLAVIKEGGLVHRLVSHGNLSTTHEITAVESLTAAYRLLESEHFDLVVCDVGFDGSQMFDLWAAVRGKEPRATFLAYRERDSDLGEAMELLVKKAVSNMGLDGYLDLREFGAEGGCTAFVDFIELALKSDKLKKGRINDHLLPSLGTMVKNLRSKLGMSLEALSEASGLKLKLLKDLENGKQMDLELNELFRLCMALDVLPSKLLREAEEE
jgi:DNA-binding Xre family transcriptional regulator/CheY-like chemotaxis protein